MKKKILSGLAVCLLVSGIVVNKGIGNPGEPELVINGTPSIINVELV